MGTSRPAAVGQRRIQAFKEMESTTCYTRLSIMDHPPGLRYPRDLPHSAELVRMCHNAGFLLKYLPPYSPNLNPIETSFSMLKAWIKRSGYSSALFR